MAEEKVRSGTTTSVAATAAYLGSSSSAADGPHLGGVLRQGLGRALVADQLGALGLQHAVAEGVVPVLVAVDRPQHRQAAHPAQVGHHAAGQLGRGLRVEHEQAVVARDHGDVDVEPRVPRHPHAVGDLIEARHPTEPSRLGTHDRRVPEATAARRVSRAGRPQARRAPGDRRGLRLHPGARRLQGAGGAPLAGRLAGHRAQRHGGAGGGGVHHPAPHQRRPDPHRQGLPAVRRPADHAQADEHRREARDRDLPRRRRRPRRRGAPLGAAALAADPPGRRRPVPHAVALHRPPRRAGRAGAQPRAGGADPLDRPGRAAAGRARAAGRPRTTWPTCAPPCTAR